MLGALLPVQGLHKALIQVLKTMIPILKKFIQRKKIKASTQKENVRTIAPPFTKAAPCQTMPNYCDKDGQWRRMKVASSVRWRMF